MIEEMISSNGKLRFLSLNGKSIGIEILTSGSLIQIGENFPHAWALRNPMKAVK